MVKPRNGKPKETRRKVVAPGSKPKKGNRSIGVAPRKLVPSGPDNAILLNLYGLRLINNYVERFHVLASTCTDRATLDSQFNDFLKQIICVIPLRSSSRGLDPKERCDADYLELRPNGEFKLLVATTLHNERWLPPMVVRQNTEGKYIRPEAGDGVAAYCVWSNLTGTHGVAVAPNVPAKTVLFFERQDTEEGGLGWYAARDVGKIYKDSPRHGDLVDKPPYRSILSAAVFLCEKTYSHSKSDDRCIGVLDITSDRPAAFSEVDCAWAELCAALIGSLFGSYQFWRDRLEVPSSQVAPQQLPSPRLPTPIPHTTDPVSDWLLSTASLDLGHFRVVGDFVCEETRLRRTLADFVYDVKSKHTATPSPIPVLLCAAPGSGKTFFVNEFAKVLGVPVALENLSDKTELKAALTVHYEDILARNAQVAFLDEADTPIGGSYAYRFLLKAMNGDPCVKPPGAPSETAIGKIIWFFAASVAPDIDSFESHVKGKVDQKGPDFLRRFREKGFIVQLPSVASPRERVLRVASMIKAPITQIDKQALLFAAVHNWRDAGELKARVGEAIRHSAGRVALRLEDLATPVEVQELSRSHATGMRQLEDSSVFVR